MSVIFICIAPSAVNSFPLICYNTLYDYITICVLNVWGHFCILVIINKAAVYILVHSSWQYTYQGIPGWQNGLPLHLLNSASFPVGHPGPNTPTHWVTFWTRGPLSINSLESSEEDTALSAPLLGRWGLVDSRLLTSHWLSSLQCMLGNVVFCWRQRDRLKIWGLSCQYPSRGSIFIPVTMTKRDFIGKEQGFREQKLTGSFTGQGTRKYQPISAHPYFFFLLFRLEVTSQWSPRDRAWLVQT